MSENPPIFIRGLSRSGGTLLVTLLDAHPEVAMSYELYPNLLDPLINDTENLSYFHDLLSGKSSINEKVQDDKKKIRTFIARSFRSGLDFIDLNNIYDELKARKIRLFDDRDDSMLFMEECALTKMRKEGKLRWGMKCSNDFSRYLSVWPTASFLNVVRDGRDVLSSQLVTGAFNKSIKKTAEGYVNSHKKFKIILENESVSAKNVFYEKLVTDSDKMIEDICEFLTIPYSDQMLNFFEKDLTIYKHSMGHLSLDRISKPIDTTKIGRWKSDLSESQVKEFNEIAKDTLIEFGYL
jgi:hypothetical protein